MLVRLAVLSFFSLSLTGLDAAQTRDAFVAAAYTGTDSLRCAFSYYRALPTSAEQIRQVVDTARLTVPTMAIGSHLVGTTPETSSVRSPTP
ncbi:hypothetical protein ACW9HJ_29825 [Nocardia gipuzkoensis]